MSKKLIIALLAIAVVSSCLLVSCKDEQGNPIFGNEIVTERPYIDSDEYPFVTRADGEIILDEDGEFYVYSTNENGFIVKDKYGEKVIAHRPFEAYKGDGFYEEYSYRFNLPDGWDTAGSNGVYVNKDTGDKFSVVIQDKSYQDVYRVNYETYEKISDGELGVDNCSVSWEENLDLLGTDCKGVTRFTLNIKGEGTNVLYFFRNQGNIYKIIYETTNEADAVKNSELLCKAITFKPYDCYEPVTNEEGKEVIDVFPEQTTEVSDSETK